MIIIIIIIIITIIIIIIIIIINTKNSFSLFRPVRRTLKNLFKISSQDKSYVLFIEWF